MPDTHQAAMIPEYTLDTVQWCRLTADHAKYDGSTNTKSSVQVWLCVLHLTHSSTRKYCTVIVNQVLHSSS
jgi:hypothetical protein